MHHPGAGIALGLSAEEKLTGKNPLKQVTLDIRDLISPPESEKSLISPQKYNEDVAAYNARASAFETANVAYENQVKLFEAGGSKDVTQYTSLLGQQAALKQQYDALNREQQLLNEQSFNVGIPKSPLERVGDIWDSLNKAVAPYTTDVFGIGATSARLASTPSLGTIPRAGFGLTGYVFQHPLDIALFFGIGEGYGVVRGAALAGTAAAGTSTASPVFASAARTAPSVLRVLETGALVTSVASLGSTVAAAPTPEAQGEEIGKFLSGSIGFGAGFAAASGYTPSIRVPSGRGLSDTIFEVRQNLAGIQRLPPESGLSFYTEGSAPTSVGLVPRGLAPASTMPPTAGTGVLVFSGVGATTAAQAMPAREIIDLQLAEISRNIVIGNPEQAFVFNANTGKLIASNVGKAEMGYIPGVGFWNNLLKTPVEQYHTHTTGDMLRDIPPSGADIIPSGFSGLQGVVSKYGVTRYEIRPDITPAWEFYKPTTALDYKAMYENLKYNFDVLAGGAKSSNPSEIVDYFRNLDEYISDKGLQTKYGVFNPVRSIEFIDIETLRKGIPSAKPINTPSSIMGSDHYNIASSERTIIPDSQLNVQMRLPAIPSYPQLLQTFSTELMVPARISTTRVTTTTEAFSPGKVTYSQVGPYEKSIAIDFNGLKLVRSGYVISDAEAFTNAAEASRTVKTTMDITINPYTGSTLVNRETTTSFIPSAGKSILSRDVSLFNLYELPPSITMKGAAAEPITSFPTGAVNRLAFGAGERSVSVDRIAGEVGRINRKGFIYTITPEGVLTGIVETTNIAETSKAIGDLIKLENPEIGSARGYRKPSPKQISNAEKIRQGYIESPIRGISDYTPAMEAARQFRSETELRNLKTFGPPERGGEIGKFLDLSAGKKPFGTMADAMKFRAATEARNTQRFENEEIQARNAALIAEGKSPMAESFKASLGNIRRELEYAAKPKLPPKKAMEKAQRLRAETESKNRAGEPAAMKRFMESQRSIPSENEPVIDTTESRIRSNVMMKIAREKYQEPQQNAETGGLASAVSDVTNRPLDLVYRDADREISTPGRVRKPILDIVDLATSPDETTNIDRIPVVSRIPEVGPVTRPGTTVNPPRTISIPDVVNPPRIGTPTESPRPPLPPEIPIPIIPILPSFGGFSPSGYGSGKRFKKFTEYLSFGIPLQRSTRRSSGRSKPRTKSKRKK